MTDYKRIINKYKKSFMSLKNVIGLGYGIKEKRGKKIGEEAIMVLVEKKLPSHKLKKNDFIPQSVEKVKTDVIEVGELRFLESRTGRMRPAQPGVSIGHYKITAGTFGAVVKDRKTGEPLILSNNHVLANITNGHDNRAQKGDPILQPGVYDDGSKPDDIIAYLERYVPIKSGNGEPQCGVAIAVERLANLLIHFFRPSYNMKFFKEEGNNLVDCAVAKPVSVKDLKTEILDIGEVKGAKEAELDMKIQKSGRTSGYTTGKIIAMGTVVKVNMSESEVAIFEDQLVTTPLSKAGDSGSLVLDMDNNAVGLLFAGSDQATVCNRVDNVMEKLNIVF